MEAEPAPTAPNVEPEAQPKKTRHHRIARRLIKLSFLIGLPLVLLPTLLPRKVSAKRLSGSETAVGPTGRMSPVLREKKVQSMVDEFKTRLSITDPVFVSIVDRNELVVSVERAKDGANAYSLSIEADFLDGLTGDELKAVVAHELGHVWIFTHHPYLQTEELANQIAMRIVSHDTLAAVYEKVWKRTGGRKGNVVYLPSVGSSDAPGRR